MSIWFTEELHPYYRKGIRVKRILADEQTQYQHLQFVETEFFGNATDFRLGLHLSGCIDTDAPHAQGIACRVG